MGKTETLIKAIFDQVREIVTPLVARVKALEARETKTLADAWRGPWMPARYSRGVLTTSSGSLWLCVKDTTTDEKPGSSDAWRLIVKGTR